METLGRYIKGACTRVLLASLIITSGFTTGQAWSEQSLLEVRVKGDGIIRQKSVEALKAIPRVSKVEPYLHISTKPYDVVGVEPEGPLRIVTSDKRLITPALEAGRNAFKQGDDRVSIVGPVYREEYERGGKPDPRHGMGGMLHLFEVGSSFVFPGIKERIRVIGIVSAKPEAEARKVFLPLATAQRLFDKVGQLTHLFLTVDAADHMDQVAMAIKSTLGDTVEVVRR